jgi:ABC-type cobalamin/Fe3+-siderophores transport system ATPase subunit
VSFRANGLGYAYGLKEASFELPPMGLITIVGPNGAGKSTLIAILAGLRRDYRGACSYAGKEIREWSRHELARHVAFLPQALRVEFPFTAEQVVFMGRTPHSNGWFDSPEDVVAVEEALRTTDALEFRDRDFRSLSGGERQRVILASALAQKPDCLLLDEPTTFLDLKHQIGMYRILADLARRMLVVAVTHDLNLARRYSHRVIVMAEGRIAGDGKPEDVLAPDTIRQVFGVQTEIREGWIQYES